MKEYLSSYIEPAFNDNNVVVCFQSSDYYAPYTSVTIQSIIDTASSNNNYDIVVTSLDMTKDNTQILESMGDCYNNISVRVLRVNEAHEKCEVIGNSRFGAETLTRVFIPEIFKNYDKVISMDSDMIVKSDIAELYNTNITNYYIGAVKDIFVYKLYHHKHDNSFYNDLVDNKLNINKPSNYHNAGLLLMNTKKIRENFTPDEIIEFINENKLRFLEQDAFNHFFYKKIYDLDMGWNYFIDVFNQIDMNDKFIPDFSLYKEYNGAANDIKIIHYLTTIKPWDSLNIPKSQEYWNIARKSPYYETILYRMHIDNPDKSSKNSYCFNNFFLPESFNNGRRILMLCETVYQLINAINLKMTDLKFYPVDLVLTSTTDLSYFLANIKQIGLFEDIQVVDYSMPKHNDIIQEKIKENPKDILKNPEEFLYGFKCEKRYTDIYFAVDQIKYNKLLYYYMVKIGLKPKVHIYEDGMSTYIENPDYNQKIDGLDHNIYGAENSYPKNIVEILLREPKLVSIPSLRIPINKISNINNDIEKILKQVFGQATLPKEKYIFFDEGFALENKVSNETDYLDIISDMVGKENIIVKLHPRNKIDFYKSRGYKTMENTMIPWEIYLLNEDFKDKVFLTVSSGSCITPKLLFNKPFNSIMLYKIMVLSERRHIRLAKATSYLDKLYSLCNENRKCLFVPKTIQEFKNQIIYIEGRMSNNE